MCMYIYIYIYIYMVSTCIICKQSTVEKVRWSFSELWNHHGDVLFRQYFVQEYSASLLEKAVRRVRRAWRGVHGAYRCLWTKTLLARKPWPCNPAAETALQPLICFLWNQIAHVSSSPEECFFHGHRYDMPGYLGTSKCCGVRYIHIYIYIERERYIYRERESVYVCVYVYRYIYIYIYIYMSKWPS